MKTRWTTFLKLGTVMALLSAVGGCDLIDYHPYDGRLDGDTPTHIHAVQIPRIEAACRDKDTIRFVWVGDTQRAYDETRLFVEAVNRREDIDFVIHGGDYTEFGLKKEFEWCVRLLEELKVPYVGLIGNHDAIGNGGQVYEEIFGEENFSFLAHDVRFVCLNTNAIEYDYSHPVPDFGFLQDELDQSVPGQRTICVMHAPPGNEQFDNNVKDVFQHYIKRFPTLLCCLHAHNHAVTAVDLFGDGIIYYGCANMAKRNYLLFTLTPEDYTYETVDF
ncbi:MAG: metallophosphoesterase family protein [Parabacteroides sp.]